MSAPHNKSHRSPRWRLAACLGAIVLGALVLIYRHYTSPVRVVTGRVTDGTTAWPIGQARVDDTTKDIFGRTLATTLSSSNGTFRLAIRGAAVGITAPGYQPKVASLRVNPLGEIENEEMYVELEKLATPHVGAGPPGGEG